MPRRSCTSGGRPRPRGRSQERIARYLSPPLFPIDVSDVPVARSCSTTCPTSRGSWPASASRPRRSRIPGPTLGYRVESGDVVVRVHPGPRAGARRRPRPQVGDDWIPGFDLALGVDLLLHDAQFTDAEYPERVGWGHSSVTDAVTFALRAGVGRLVLFHHDPWHADGELDELEDRARELWNGAGEPPLLAREGMHVDAAPDGHVLTAPAVRLAITWNTCQCFGVAERGLPVRVLLVEALELERRRAAPAPRSRVRNVSSGSPAHSSRSPKSWPLKRPPGRTEATTRSQSASNCSGGQNGSA